VRAPSGHGLDILQAPYNINSDGELLARLCAATGTDYLIKWKQWGRAPLTNKVWDGSTRISAPAV
jgi:hypothetical protein